MKRVSNMTKRVGLFSMAFCICSTLAWEASAQTGNDNIVTSLNYSQESERTLVEIGVQSDPTFSVYSLKSPDRVVVEILDCNASDRVSPVQVRNGVIDTAAVSVSQSNEYDTCRVILGLEKEATYTVDSDDKRITIAVNGVPKGASEMVATDATVSQQNRQTAFAQAQAIAEREQAESPVDAAFPDILLAAVEPDDANEIAASAETVEIAAVAAEPAEVAQIPADTPVEVAEVTPEPAVAEVPETEAMFAQAATTEGSSERPALADIVTTAEITEAPKVAAPIDFLAAADASIQDLRFEPASDDGMRVIVELTAPVDKVETVDAGNQKSILRIGGAKLPDNFNKKYDTTAFNRGVQFIDSTQSDGSIELVAMTAGQTIDSVEQNGSTVTWNLKPARDAYKISSDRRDNAMVSAAAPSAIGGGPTNFSASSLKDSPLGKRKITLDINDADITDLLRLLSDEINTSIVVSPDVKGKITLSLKSVPLDQAMDIILKMHDLGMRYEGNVIWVAKGAAFRAEIEREQREIEIKERNEPLEVRLIPINYAQAEDLSSNVQSLLSSRGSVNIDSRTNTLILKDVAANLDAAELLIDNLDRQTPQILIEARIVETQANFTKEIGIQWGGDGIFSAATGNPTGIVFPSSIGIAGGSTSDNNAGTSSSPNFAVNLPAGVGTGSGGAIGLSLGSVGGAVNLNLRLSALETKGFLKIVSSPRIMTLDNVQANIEQGTSIPISVVSAAGAQTMFFDATLNLSVTPHVTRDAHVYLKIEISKNEPDFGNTGADGNPSIIRKQAQTELLIADGETTVIGGIYTRNTSQSMSSVPFFGSIPILGYLFRNTSETDNRTELLLFITPRIINRDAAIASSTGSFIPPVSASDKAAESSTGSSKKK